MLILDRDGTQCRDGRGDRTDGQAITTMIERLIAALSHPLGQRVLALHVWRQAHNGSRASASR